MTYLSFVLQAAKPSWLTATEGSFGSASWIKAETVVSASATWVRFQAKWTEQLERRDVYQDYQNNWSGKRNWRKPTHKGATTWTHHSQELQLVSITAPVSIGRFVGPNHAPKPNTCFGFRVEPKWTNDVFLASYCDSIMYWECDNHIWHFCLHLTAQTYIASEDKKLDDGWPESVEEQGLLLLVLGHYITRQYIKNVF